MHRYSKAEKRLIRDYAARAYDAELAQALGELEWQFGAWRSGQISADELSTRISDFTRGPLRELRQRYSANLDDMQVAHAIATGAAARQPARRAAGRAPAGDRLLRKPERGRGRGLSIGSSPAGPVPAPRAMLK